MMMSAKMMSEKIRMKRKKVKEDGMENMVDTSPKPQMNPQDIHNQKMNAQIEATIGHDDKPEGPSDPADADIAGSSQEKMELKRKMMRIQSVFNKLKP